MRNDALSSFAATERVEALLPQQSARREQVLVCSRDLSRTEPVTRVQIWQSSSNEKNGWGEQLVGGGNAERAASCF
jgi:hypothetical protein